MFDPSTRSISLELALTESLAAGERLALTSIVQLTPTETSDAEMIRRLASYHELAPSTDLEPGSTWTAAGLSLSHVPNHANDGPVSAFLIHADNSTSPVTVEPMRRAGVSDQGHERAADRSHGSSSTEWNLVPYPVSMALF